MLIPMVVKNVAGNLKAPKTMPGKRGFIRKNRWMRVASTYNITEKGWYTKPMLKIILLGIATTIVIAGSITAINHYDTANAQKLANEKKQTNSTVASIETQYKTAEATANSYKQDVTTICNYAREAAVRLSQAKIGISVSLPNQCQ
jgi:hypothetical protein